MTALPPAAQTPSGIPDWPFAGSAPVLVLAFVSTTTEAELVKGWVTSSAGDASAVQILDVARLEAGGSELPTNGATIITPVRVAWSDSKLAGPAVRNALGRLALSKRRARRQERALGADPGSAHVLVAETASLDELRSRFTTRTNGAETLEFFVRRQAELALDRRDRQLMGGPSKVPRYVREEVRTSRRFSEGVQRLAIESGRRPRDIATQGAEYLKEMVADHNRIALQAFERFGRFLHRAHTVSHDEAQFEMLRTLNQHHSLVFLPSHRSYLDPFIIRSVLMAHGFPVNSTFGGNNMAFWPMGDWMRSTGNIVLRRHIGDDPVYKFVMRTYLQYLASKRLNIEWYIEGGRTRTGKLRPPKYGLLTYLVDAVEAMGPDDDVMLVPVGLVYDGLSEVSSLTAELSGTAKKSEQISWLVKYPRSTGAGFGRVHVSVGEPMLLRATLDKFGDESRRDKVHKVAFEVCHRINQATPVTATALVTLALLGVDDRAMTLPEIRSVVEPFLTYFERRKLPVTVDLKDQDELQSVLEWLASTGVATRYDGGADTVWGIAPDRHLEAAFYRNGLVHQLVNRSIVELVVSAAADGRITNEHEAWGEALRLRDLFKFEFFFPEKEEFRANLLDEIGLMDPDWMLHVDETAFWNQLLSSAEPHLAHRTLHSFVEAYYVVADRLAQLAPTRAVDEDLLVRDAFGFARQRRLQRHLRSSDAISTDVMRNALLVAAHRELLGSGGDDLVRQRREFANELHELLIRVERMRDLASPSSKREAS